MHHVKIQYEFANRYQFNDFSKRSLGSLQKPFTYIPPWPVVMYHFKIPITSTKTCSLLPYNSSFLA